MQSTWTILGCQLWEYLFVVVQEGEAGGAVEPISALSHAGLGDLFQIESPALHINTLPFPLCISLPFGEFSRNDRVAYFHPDHNDEWVTCEHRAPIEPHWLFKICPEEPRRKLKNAPCPLYARQVQHLIRLQFTKETARFPSRDQHSFYQFMHRCRCRQSSCWRWPRWWPYQR